MLETLISFNTCVGKNHAFVFNNRVGRCLLHAHFDDLGRYQIMFNKSLGKAYNFLPNSKDIGNCECPCRVTELKQHPRNALII